MVYIAKKRTVLLMGCVVCFVTLFYLIALRLATRDPSQTRPVTRKKLPGVRRRGTWAIQRQSEGLLEVGSVSAHKRKRRMGRDGRNRKRQRKEVQKKQMGHKRRRARHRTKRSTVSEEFKRMPTMIRRTPSRFTDKIGTDTRKQPAFEKHGLHKKHTIEEVKVHHRSPSLRRRHHTVHTNTEVSSDYSQYHHAHRENIPHIQNHSHKPVQHNYSVHQKSNKSSHSAHNVSKKSSHSVSNMSDESGHSIYNVSDKSSHSIRKRHIFEAGQMLEPSVPLEVRTAVIQHLVLDLPFSQQRSEGQEVELPCENSAMEVFKREIPMFQTQWLLNGEPLKVKASRMLFRGDDLTIQDLTTKDSGVYECRVEWSENRAITIAVFALSVTTKVPDLFPRETEPLSLDCHSQHLAGVLLTADMTLATDPDFGCKPPCQGSNLTHRSTRQWFHNDSTTSLLPDNIPAVQSGPETLGSSTRAMSGVWWCQMTHMTGNKRWNTSWHRVFVKDPPSKLELWWRSVLARPWLVALIGVTSLLTCIALSTLVARHAQKQDENLERRWQVMKARMIRRTSQLEASLSLTSQSIDDVSVKHQAISSDVSGNKDTTGKVSSPSDARPSSRGMSPTVTNSRFHDRSGTN